MKDISTVPTGKESFAEAKTIKPSLHSFKTEREKTQNLYDIHLPHQNSHIEDTGQKSVGVRLAQVFDSETQRNIPHTTQIIIACKKQANKQINKQANN